MATPAPSSIPKTTQINSPVFTSNNSAATVPEATPTILSVPTNVPRTKSQKINKSKRQKGAPVPAPQCSATSYRLQNIEFPAVTSHSEFPEEASIENKKSSQHIWLDSGNCFTAGTSVRKVKYFTRPAVVGVAGPRFMLFRPMKQGVAKSSHGFEEYKTYYILLKTDPMPYAAAGLTEINGFTEHVYNLPSGMAVKPGDCYGWSDTANNEVIPYVHSTKLEGASKPGVTDGWTQASMKRAVPYFNGLTYKEHSGLLTRYNNMQTLYVQTGFNSFFGESTGRFENRNRKYALEVIADCTSTSQLRV
jgi:hypothetical protein